MIPAHLEKALAELEFHVNTVSAALVSGEPVALEAASGALRQAAIDFSALLQRLAPSDLKNQDLKLRLKKIAEGLTTQRTSLIRRTALVEMALNAIVPASRDTTYAQAAGPYGSVGKQTGAIKYLAA